MRLTVLALAMLPVTAFAQETTLPAPTEPVAQSQGCPVGMAWDDAAGACAAAANASSPLKSMGGQSGCSHNATREITS